MRTSLTLAASALLAVFANATPLEKRYYEWEIIIYEKGGCPKDSTTAAETQNGNFGCVNIPIEGSSAVWINENGECTAYLYFGENCTGNSEVFNKGDRDMCYGSAVFLKGPDYWSSYKIVC